MFLNLTPVRRLYKRERVLRRKVSLQSRKEDQKLKQIPKKISEERKCELQREDEMW
jgi:hypothetical protein